VETLSPPRDLFPRELPLIVLFRQISALEKESSQL
jgi:hypothetical protein